MLPVCVCVCLRCRHVKHLFSTRSDSVTFVSFYINISQRRGKSVEWSAPTGAKQNSICSWLWRKRCVCVCVCLYSMVLRIAPLFGPFALGDNVHKNKHMPTITDWLLTIGFCPRKEKKTEEKKNENETKFSLVFRLFVFRRRRRRTLTLLWFSFGSVCLCVDGRPRVIRTSRTIIFDCFLFVTFHQTTSRRIQTILTWPLQQIGECGGGCWIFVRAETLFWRQLSNIFYFYSFFVFFFGRSLCRQFCVRRMRRKCA